MRAANRELTRINNKTIKTIRINKNETDIYHCFDWLAYVVACLDTDNSTQNITLDDIYSP